jgi:hypothetical protein
MAGSFLGQVKVTHRVIASRPSQCVVGGPDVTRLGLDVGA